MGILFVLVPLSLVLVGLAVGIFVWMARSGQFDDLDNPRHRLPDDEDAPPPAGARRRG
ncbi:MAG: cbb3-type cytochrome oxidase assembly protein CcoS [Nevskia sp.]|nr:cbb3-type cytochrome oxidase assembly protein CcoS [Nevskia sp.]